MDRPKNQTVLLFHGFGSNSHQTFVSTGWFRTLERAGFRILAPELPGHCGLPAPVNRSELEHWALQQAQKAIHRHGPIALAGYSLGATLAWSVGLESSPQACLAPESITSLALVGTPLQDHLCQLARGIKNPQTRFLEELISSSEHPKNLRLLAEAMACDPWDGEKLLSQGLLPQALKLVASGSQDGIALAPEEFLYRAKQAKGAEKNPLISGIETLNIPGRDHVSALTSAELRRSVARVLSTPSNTPK